MDAWGFSFGFGLGLVGNNEEEEWNFVQFLKTGTVHTAGLYINWMGMYSTVHK